MAQIVTLMRKLVEATTKASLATSFNDYQENHEPVTRILDAITLYSSTEDAVIPGLELAELKRDIRIAKNAYHGAFTGVIDKEIKLAKGNREIGKITATMQKHLVEIQVAENRAQVIAQACLPSSTISDDDKAVLAARKGLTKLSEDPAKEIKSLGEEVRKLNQEAHEEEQRLLQGRPAPTNAEEWRNLQKRQIPDVDEVKVQQERDENQFNQLAHYQPALQRLANTRPLPNTSWCIGRGPIFFNSNPPISEMHIKKMHVPYSAFFPGYILENQYLLGVDRETLQKKNELYELLTYLKQVIGSRIESDPVFMNLPMPKRTLDPPQGNVKFKDDGSKVKNAAGIRREEISNSLPKFFPLQGSRMFWTWILPNSKYKSVPHFRVLNFGFPMAATLRSLEERLGEKITDNLPAIQHGENVKVVDKMSELRKELMQRHVSETHDLRVELQGIQEKLAEYKTKTDEIAKIIEGLKQQQQHAQYNLRMAKNNTAKTNATKILEDVESSLSVQAAKIKAFRDLVKAQRDKELSLNSQITAHLNAMRMELRDRLK